MGPIDNKFELVYVMAWHQSNDIQWANDNSFHRWIYLSSGCSQLTENVKGCIIGSFI